MFNFFKNREPLYRLREAKYFKIFISAMTLLIFIEPNLVHANSYSTTDGRYLTYVNKPLPEQKNLMLQTIQVHFPVEVKTIGDAINYLLKPSGYTLAPMDKASTEVKKMVMFNLPIVDRNFGPMTLQDALKTLVGDSFILRIDRLNRQVSFYLLDRDDD